MTQPSHATLSATGQSFVEHLAAFYAGLPVEEQILLEKFLALAEPVTEPPAETAGFMLSGLAAPQPGRIATPDRHLSPRPDENQFSFVMRVNKASPML